MKITETIQLGHSVLLITNNTDMWPILLSAMIMVNPRRHHAILSENKVSGRTSRRSTEGWLCRRSWVSFEETVNSVSIAIFDFA